MKVIRLISILICVLAVLAAINIYSSILSDRADAEKVDAYETRHVFTAALHQFQLASEALSRLSRAWIMLGTIQYDAYMEVLAGDQIGETLRIFTEHGATPDEINLLNAAIALSDEMRSQEALAFQAMYVGDAELALSYVYTTEYAVIGFAFVDALYTLVDEVVYRTQNSINAAESVSTHYAFLSRAITVLFAVISVVGTVLILFVVKAAQKSEQEAEERARLMFEASPAAVILFDKDMNPLACNENAAKLLGFSNKEDYLQNFYTLTTPNQPDGTDSTEMVTHYFTKALNEGIAYMPEFICRKTDGTLFPIETTYIRIRYKNDFAVIEYSLDITEKKVAREREVAISREQAASSAKSRFLFNMSHEIRTPMSAIIGMTNIAKNSDNLEKKDYCINIIEKASSHLLGILNQILDMSKIEADKFELNLHSFDFRKMISEVTSILVIGIEEKQLTFKVELDADIPHLLVSDGLRLAQVLANLLANAVKFTQEGGTLTLGAVWTADDEDATQGVLGVEVTDTGIGMSEDVLSRLFDSFEQADTGITRNYGGTGLGLAISKRIVEMLGGSILAESEPGKGSRFVFTIPMQVGEVAGEASGTDSSKEGIQGVELDFSDYTILMAEDIAINCEIASALLEPTGVNIEYATDGEQAVQMFRDAQERYDLILMDVQMPRMDGITATRVIRELGTSSSKSIPIVALTANVFKEDIDTCLEAGMNDHLGKPLNFNQMIATLKKYFGNVA